MTEMRRGAVRPFGATEPQLRSEILGADATDECATRALTRYYISGPRRGTPRVAKYAVALRGGHRVVPLIAEVWGGFAVDAMSFLRGLAIARGDTLDVERLSTTWAARGFFVLLATVQSSNAEEEGCGKLESREEGFTFYSALPPQAKVQAPRARAH